jgi:hypothetical protein
MQSFAERLTLLQFNLCSTQVCENALRLEGGKSTDRHEE